MTTYQWGYAGIAPCDRCSFPDHLWVNSLQYADQNERCDSCIKNLAIYSNSDEETKKIETLIANRPNARPDLFPIVNEPLDVCQACFRPEYQSKEGYNRWDFTEGMLRDGRMIIIHSRCKVYCGECNESYATPNYHAIREQEKAKYNYDDYADIDSIDGHQMCNRCREQYIENNGGDDNFFTCEYCEQYTSNDNSMSYEGSDYCTRCYENNVYTCYECDDQYWDGNGHDCESEFIHDYSYRPIPQFFGAGKYHLGFELEVEAKDSSRRHGASIATDSLGSRAYLKSDGSLNDGFEIVTHPHTLEKYQHDFEWSTLKALRREGFRSWDTSTCGLHVHISRTAFGDSEGDYSHQILSRQSHELRFMKLIYDNQRQVERIAGRSENHYAQFSDKGKLVAKVKHGNQTDGRYSAVNTENDDTLEVRVFRGSLRKERVLSALEFVTACTEYTRALPVSGKNRALSWLRFTAYVSNNEEKYPNLATIMSEAFANDPITQDQ